jgi:hypothetical protein
MSLSREEYGHLMTLRSMSWVGPLTIDQLLDNWLTKSVWPPDSNGVYLVSRFAWTGRWPSDGCLPLYVGSNTGKSPRFRTRIGDLIADMFGFFGESTGQSSGHSSGGVSLHDYCVEERLTPKQLFICWVDNCTCLRCAETYVCGWLEPKLNKNRPPRCREHQESQKLQSAFGKIEGG